MTNNRVAIYQLKNERGSIFYVGSTLNPLSRWNAHCRKFGPDTEMVILRWVDSSLRAVEEARELVKCYDDGAALVNLATPAALPLRLAENQGA